MRSEPRNRAALRRGAESKQWRTGPSNSQAVHQTVDAAVQGLNVLGATAFQLHNRQRGQRASSCVAQLQLKGDTAVLIATIQITTQAVVWPQLNGLLFRKPHRRQCSVLEVSHPAAVCLAPLSPLKIPGGTTDTTSYQYRRSQRRNAIKIEREKDLHPQRGTYQACAPKHRLPTHALPTQLQWEPDPGLLLYGTSPGIEAALTHQRTQGSTHSATFPEQLLRRAARPAFDALNMLAKVMDKRAKAPRWPSRSGLMPVTVKLPVRAYA